MYGTLNECDLFVRLSL